MKYKMKLVATLSLGLIGGGILISASFIGTSCGGGSKVQTITGETEISADYGAGGESTYKTNADTSPTWSITGPNLPQITIGATTGVLTWGVQTPSDDFEIRILCVAPSYQDATLDIILFIS